MSIRKRRRKKKKRERERKEEEEGVSRGKREGRRDQLGNEFSQFLIGQPHLLNKNFPKCHNAPKKNPLEISKISFKFTSFYKWYK